MLVHVVLGKNYTFDAVKRFGMIRKHYITFNDPAHARAGLFQEISKGGKVLLHCVAGISRSATICIAYLMKHGGFNLLEAYNYTKMKRPIIKPNCGFFRQLIQYEKVLYGAGSVSMVYNDMVKMEIPDVYDVDYKNIITCRRKRKDLVRRH